jgi:hypothetical protein
VPTSTFDYLQKQYKAVPAKVNPPIKIGENWFEKHTRREDNESDIAFEYRIIRTLAALFGTVRQIIANSSKQTTQVDNKDMGKNPLDKKIFYFNDARVVYSINEIDCLIKSGKATTTESIIRITEGLSFKAGDIIKNAMPLLHDLLTLTIDEPTTC